MLTCSSVRALLKRGVAAGKSEKLGERGEGFQSFQGGCRSNLGDRIPEGLKRSILKTPS